MSLKEVFVSQLRACHDQNTWFVSLNNAIKGVTAEQAAWKNDKSTHSIQEIVHHLAYYNKRYLNRFKGIQNADGANSIDATFHNPEEQTWQSTMVLIDDIMTEWRQSVEESDDKKIDDWAGELAHLTLHNTYHIGQIVHIRKQHGIWNPEQGVQ
ncbi:DinB superfamily protein [Lentibacillus halodurans]|uniref:DinB superfamily protein n=1 Tax=Lentibacillus halodurans TaxID=237679 RepID=A0A1I0X2P0_9BACI|nr:DinB family protein [Lentibacillus halodurans]SFA95272.1 DinB superfamily protein [Lentibacillus halodurans]